MFINTLRCKVIIASGMTRSGVYAIKLARFLKKKTVFIMHGCGEIESVLNNICISQKLLQWEQYILHNADLILPVSKRYSELICKEYPFCEGRLAYLHNGVNRVIVDYNSEIREKGNIIAVGGDRKLKNNIVVAKAMAKLNSNSVLKVYGYLYNPENLPLHDNIEFIGLVPQEQLYRAMLRSELYVLNSIYEPFALSVFDALLCGCSVLVSNVAGALELLEVTEQDVIYNPMDENEIAEKIEYLLCNPNNERLLKNLNFEEISYKAQARKLEDYCKNLCVKEG